MKLNKKNLIIIFLILISIFTVDYWTNLVIGNVAIYWLVNSLIIFSFLNWRKHLFDSNDKSNIRIINIYVFWIICCAIRGIFVAENYWEFKNLIDASMYLLLPLSIYVFTNKLFSQFIFNNWLRYALPCFVLLLPFILKYAYGQYLAPVSYILLFFPVLSKKWKIITLFILGVVLFSDLGARSNVIKFIVPLLISCIYYIPILNSKRILEGVRLFLFPIPIVLLLLGITGVFNVFKMDQYIEGDYKTENSDAGKSQVEDLKVDTRTFLYKEVIASAVKNNYTIFGRTPARGNESASFGYVLAVTLKTGKLERFNNEVSILNIFTWTGLIGAILYMLIFYQATNLAINKSNNIFMKIIGIYIVFRWIYCWVEDFSHIDLFNVFLWLLLGMCFSNSIRGMTNREMINWIKGIFEERYRFSNIKNLPNQTIDSEHIKINE